MKKYLAPTVTAVAATSLVVVVVVAFGCIKVVVSEFKNVGKICKPLVVPALQVVVFIVIVVVGGGGVKVEVNAKSRPYGRHEV